ncbi:hypothetical protein RF11_07068 [Thelohanellus kitauei]|uniref:Uncharacterized protein n=1 Tax=Thelohanellus kitauei TaxID=669202 RepID=A0A0C2M560_THEKT|nr:hypothetical protein RF11_07068 [Thelohanellus kitauei]
MEPCDHIQLCWIPCSLQPKAWSVITQNTSNPSRLNRSLYLISALVVIPILKVEAKVKDGLPVGMGAKNESETLNFTKESLNMSHRRSISSGLTQDIDKR